jgi:predicted transglutaminase-like cysteine proteinase
LLKKRDLEGLGFPSSSLLITVVLDENNEGHAVLTVSTDAGDYVLDNRRDDILLWNETNYRFLKRQTQRDPKQWVSLDDAKTIATASIGSKTGN